MQGAIGSTFDISEEVKAVVELVMGVLGEVVG
jgi:hypothetical protein